MIRDSLSVRQIWGAMMGKPHPVELRQRVVDHVAEGNTHRSTAARFRVSVKFVNDMVKLMKETGGLAPKAQGNGGGHGKLSPLKDWVARRIAEKRDLTAAGLAAEITAAHGMAGASRLGLAAVARAWADAQKKTCRPSSRSGPRWPPCATSGSPGASPSWPTC